MTSGAFNTEAATMATAATKVADVNAQIGSELSSLFGAVEAVQAHWTGQAAASFQSLMSNFREQTTKLQGALQGISEQISMSGKAYTASDDAATQAVQRSAGGLNMG